MYISKQPTQLEARQKKIRKAIYGQASLTSKAKPNNYLCIQKNIIGRQKKYKPSRQVNVYSQVTNKRVYSISIFLFFPQTYRFIWPYSFSFSTLLAQQIFHSTRLFGPLLLLFSEITLSTLESRLQNKRSPWNIWQKQ